MADTGTGLDDRHTGIVAHIVDEGTAPARYDEVDLAHCTEQTSRSLAMSGKKGTHSGVDAVFLEYAMDDFHHLAIGALGIGASLEQTHVAALDAECKHIGRDIGTRLIDDADDPEGYAYLADGHTIGALCSAVSNAEG